MMCAPYFGLSGDQPLQPVFLWRDPRQPLRTGRYGMVWYVYPFYYVHVIIVMYGAYYRYNMVSCCRCHCVGLPVIL